MGYFTGNSIHLERHHDGLGGGGGRGLDVHHYVVRVEDQVLVQQRVGLVHLVVPLAAHKHHRDATI